MARPQKEGIDYFSLDCQFNDKVKLIQAEFGPVGIGILVKLWQKIYGEKGYYTAWDNDVALVFAQDCKAGANVVKEVVSACLRRGIFDREKFEQHHILTSEGIQERYAEATERRTVQKINELYLLIPMPSNWVSANDNAVNVDNNHENVDNNPQSKVNKSIVNNSIYNTTTTARAKANQKDGKLDILPPTFSEAYLYFRNELGMREKAADEAEKFLGRFNPVFMDFIPLTLEEVFVSEMEAIGYDTNNIIF
jgi:hypothetical protein